MLFSKTLLSTLGVLVLSSAGSGQSVLRVDPLDPGAFSTIQSAVDAAVDGDTIVVAPGTYREFSVIGKGVAIVGDVDSGAAVDIIGSPTDPLATRIEGVPAGERTLLRGLRFLGIMSAFGGPGGLLGPNLVVADNAGVVFLEDLVVDPDGAGGIGLLLTTIDSDEAVRVTASHSVVLVHSVVEGATGSVNGSGNEIGARALSVTDGTVYEHGSALRAGPTTADGADGADGVRLEQATLVLRDSTITGGEGGLGCSTTLTCPFPVAPGDGGPGLRLDSESTATSIGSQVLGGAGGTDLLGGFPPGQAGPPVLAVSGAVFDEQVLAVETTLGTTSVVRAGSDPAGPELRVVLEGAPSATAAYFFDFQTPPVFAPGLPGFLAFGLGAVVVLDSTDAFGIGGFDLEVAALPPGVHFPGFGVQAVTLAGDGSLDFSNPSIFVIVGG